MPVLWEAWAVQWQQPKVPKVQVQVILRTWGAAVLRPYMILLVARAR